jgi:hypothetical protein
MLAHASAAMGRGRAFGLHEALDQSGAQVGARVIAGLLAAGGQSLRPQPRLLHAGAST